MAQDSMDQIEDARSGQLAGALDAILDEAQGIARENDVTTLPPWAQQLCALLAGAVTVSDELLESMSVPDPDDDDGDGEPTAVLTAPAPPEKAAEAKRMANGSYPISDQHSANSAWKLRNHSKDYSEAQVVAHIRAACKSLGLHFPGDTQKAAAGPIRMANGSYPISDQHSANSAWDLRGRSAKYSEAQVVSHIRLACRQLGLHFPGSPQDAADQSSRAQWGYRAHGFIYPAGLPPCSVCGEDANSGMHVNPPRMGGVNGLAYAPGVRRVVSADQMGPMRQPRRAHVYTTGYHGMSQNLTCTQCGQSMGASVHTPGMPVGRGLFPQQASVRERVAAEPGYVPPVQQAFITTVDDRVVVTGPGSLFNGNLDGLPRELAAAWEKASAANKLYLWVEGKYVEAEKANRNNAFWTAGDLELGEPTVAHGPLNWLHQEHHVIGTIAAAKLIPARQAADANGSSQAHIRSLAAVWGYLFPTEARQVAQASDEGKLWYSMECISREVACQALGCHHVQPYRQYVTEVASRCPHVRDGGPRRFVDPSFLGGAVIVPPVRPGWAGASASVLRQAAAEIERQTVSSFAGLTDEEAVAMTAQVLTYAGGMQR